MILTTGSGCAVLSIDPSGLDENLANVLGIIFAIVLCFVGVAAILTILSYRR